MSTINIDRTLLPVVESTDQFFTRQAFFVHSVVSFVNDVIPIPHNPFSSSSLVRTSRGETQDFTSSRSNFCTLPSLAKYDFGE